MDDARYVARKLAHVLRKRGLQAPYPGTDFVRRVLAKCEGQSVLSGERDVKRLCIVQVDPGQGWTPDNAVVVTSAEGYALSRTQDGACRQALLLGHRGGAGVRAPKIK